MIRKLDDDLPLDRGASEVSPLGWTADLANESAAGGADRRASPIAESARLVLEIVPGERRLLPEFGCRLHCLPSLETPAERRLGAALVEEALERWLPGLGVDDVEVVGVEERLIHLCLRVRGIWHPLAITHRRPQAGVPAEDDHS